MSQENDNAQPQVKQTTMKPTCPHCRVGGRPGENGAPLAMTQLIMGPVLCAVIFCGECGTIITAQILEMSTAAMGKPQPQVILPS